MSETINIKDCIRIRWEISYEGELEKEDFEEYSNSDKLMADCEKRAVEGQGDHSYVLEGTPDDLNWYQVVGEDD